VSNMGFPNLLGPPRSPDLNPIENIWSILKDRLNKWHPQPELREGMAEAIQKECRQISEVHPLTFVDSMPE